MTGTAFATDRPDSLDGDVHFGAGGSEPYDSALAQGGGILTLIDRGNDESVGDIDVSVFSRPAGSADIDMLRRATGPVIDIGCGPGRIVRAAVHAGMLALGVDTSSTAVSIARRAGLPVLHHSVFHPLPAQGLWGSAVVIDGNIGIGGDPLALLDRCARLIRPDGTVLVETHPDDARDHIFDAVLADEHGRRSLPFPWAEVGLDALDDYAREAGLTIRSRWSAGRRRFAQLSRLEPSADDGAGSRH